MLLYYVIVAILFLSAIASLAFVFFRRFMIVRINGASMEPTFKHGQIRVVDRFYSPERMKNFSTLEGLEKRIFVIWSPDNLPIIKRLIYISQSAEGRAYWFEGDNPDYSMDSRHYGFLYEDGFIGEVIGFKEILRRLFTLKTQ